MPNHHKIHQDNITALRSALYDVSTNDFDAFALNVFQYQYEANKIYRAWVQSLNVNPDKINEINQIPFLPIRFFKEHMIMTGQWTHEIAFESSGTTGQQRSRHYLDDKTFYLQHTARLFEEQYGAVEDMHVLCLLPSYLERKGSSLVAMCEYFVDKSQSQYSGFYLYDHDALHEKLGTLQQLNDSRKVLLIGVAFGLLDFVAQHKMRLDDRFIVMETGGMKGRGEEIVRPVLHNLLQEGLGVAQVHSEYGMTELMSQAYAREKGVFESNRFMRVMAREINDPLSAFLFNKTGVLKVIDLGNIHSCSFIETEDLGLVNQDYSFEVLGRMDNSEARGCSLMLIS